MVVPHITDEETGSCRGPKETAPGHVTSKEWSWDSIHVSLSWEIRPSILSLATGFASFAFLRAFRLQDSSLDIVSLETNLPSSSLSKRTHLSVPEAFLAVTGNIYS